MHSAGLQSTSVPRLTRLLSPRRSSFDHRRNTNALLSQQDNDSMKQRVMADSATVLSFAELRRSIEDVAGHNDAESVET